MASLDEVRAAVGPLPGTDLPIAFLPVQIQTRFVTRDDVPQLLVRVYPDDLHLDSHPEALTAAEVRWGRRYWELIWPAGADQDALRRAWEALATRFGARRAAWVRRVLNPVNLGQRPGTPPAFPDPGPLREETTFHRVHARLLPDRWVVSGHRGSTRLLLAFGAPIPDGLPVSPDPLDTPGPAAAGDDELPIDAGMRWMVDFEAAEQVGMAIRVVRPPTALDTLLVFGVRAGLDPQAGTEQLEALLDGHHYTSGLAFVPPGTPTNNTADESAGYRRTEPDPEVSFATEVAAPPAVQPGSDAGLAARLLGLRAELFASVEGVTLTEDRASHHLQNALWPVTGGYYLEHILQGGLPGSSANGFGFEVLDRARRFFVEFVRHQGPLPTLRIGHQPYGLLPAIALDPLASRPDTDGRLVQALRALRQVWRVARLRVPHLSADTQDDENLVEILRMQPVSVGYRVRLAFEQRFFTADGLLVGGLDPELAQHTELLRQRLFELWGRRDWPFSRMLGAVPTEAARLIREPLVQPGGEAPGARLDPDYLTFLRTATFDDVLTDNLPGGGPRVLLYRLLRHAVLMEQATTVSRILGRGDPFSLPLREETLVDIIGGQEPRRTRTLLRVMDEAPALRLRERIHELGRADEPEAAVLDQLRASLTVLGRLPVDSLARHVGGCLDLFSYRLDAWITALATRRLHELRRQRPGGLVLGGFGWVERLTPARRTPVTEPIPGEEGPLSEGTERGGYIHAPSMSHAAAAAVLRSGYLADTGENGARPFAVDLRSSRVRLAQWLLDGVRQGQPLDELLGYRLERGLHEHGLDRFIAGFRRVSRLHTVFEPLSHPELQRRLTALRQRYGWPQTTVLAEMERLTAAMVTDGLELARLHLAGRVPFARVGQGITAEEQRGLDRQLAELADTVDALSDALTAESVYQAVRGNPARAAATVDAVANGDIPPPELQVAQTPRPGTAQTHRVVVLFSGPAPAQPNPGVRRVRTAAEPAIDAWLRQLLGPLDRVRFRAEAVVGDGAVPIGDELRLDRLGISHLDLLYLTAGARPGQPSDLDRLLEHDLRRAAPASVPPEAPLRLLGARPAGLAANLLSLNELLELLRAFRETILAARAVDGRDLAPADAEPAPGVDAAELRVRADRALQALPQAQMRLADAVQAVAGNTDPGRAERLLDVLRERLVDMVFLGCPEAVPVSARGAEQREPLLAQADGIHAEADRRVAQEAELRAGVDRSTAAPEELVRHDQERLRAILGPSFLALPLVRPAGALATAFQASDTLQGGDPLQAFSWLQGMSRVRPAASRLTRALTCAAALDRPSALDLRVGQLPFEQGDRWIALPDPPAGGYPAGKLSLVAHLPRPFRADVALSGLLIDEWVDVVPAAEVTTGVAVHTESPGARPPQSVLLAVAPPSETGWDVELIEKTLLETLELAKLRTVDPQALTDDVLAHRALPATYLTVNRAGDTLSTDFMPGSG